MNTAVVHLAGTETISEAKTFSASIIGSTTGNAAVACPDAYGAAGNGSTDDTVAIQAALNSGMNVQFSPGKTYIVSGTLVVPPGIVVELCGATVKRAAQVVTTTSTAINTSTMNPTLTVASSTGFVVGGSISVTTGGAVDVVYPTNRGSGYSSNPTVAVTPNPLDIGAVASDRHRECERGLGQGKLLHLDWGRFGYDPKSNRCLLGR